MEKSVTKNEVNKFDANELPSKILGSDFNCTEEMNSYNC